MCPTPSKRKFSTKRIARQSFKGARKEFSVYLCSCGYWHHTHRRGGKATQSFYGEDLRTAP